MDTPWHISGAQGTAYGSQFSLTIWIQGTKIRSSVLATATFTISETGGFSSTLPTPTNGEGRIVGMLSFVPLS